MRSKRGTMVMRIHYTHTFGAVSSGAWNNVVDVAEHTVAMLRKPSALNDSAHSLVEAITRESTH
jgi:hypothetical protein